MSAGEKFSRVRLATLVVGTNMLRCVFEKRRDKFCFNARLKEKLNMKDFNPSSMNFMQLYELCAKNVVEEIRPSEEWGKDFVDSRDISLGDDIKRLKLLLDLFLKSNIQYTTNIHDDICKTLNDIVKRFLISEKVDLAWNFQYIMHHSVADDVNKDFDLIFDKGITDPVRQKYKITSVKPEFCQNPENKDNSSHQNQRLTNTGKERFSKNTPLVYSTGSIKAIPDSESNWWKQMIAMKENISKRIHTGINCEDARKVGSLSGRKVPSFTHSQIYFDFVPPALNYFEYTMKELSSIEQSLNRIIGPPYDLKTPVSDYMSFTFVYAEHMDLTNASLALFDAEAEKQDDKDNKSRIIVVYLDKDMTFEMLKEITSNTTLPVTPDEDVNLYLAVHSEQLLPDRSKLESIMSTFLGKKPMILDAYTEMKRLYNRFKRLSRQVLLNVENLYKDVVKEYGKEKANVKALAKRLSKLRRLINPEKIKGIKEASVETKQELSSLKEDGLIGYTMDNETLVLCFKRQSNQFSKDMIPNNIKKEFPKTKIIYMSKLYSVQCGITSGEKLHPFKNISESYGTVGMIGSFRPKTGETSTMCCISSPHVISAYKTAFFRDATVLLGTCIWPSPVPNHEVNVEDISVISLDKHIQICKRQPGDVKLFEEVDRHNLDKRKVFKFGATTGKTLGFVCKTDFILELGQPINVFLIEPYDKSDEESTFSEPGDSGAVVLTKFGQRVEAFSMVFAGDVNIPEIAKNNTIAVELKHAVDKFEHSHGNILELNTL